MIIFAAHTHRRDYSNAFEWAGQPTKIAPSCGVSTPYLIHGSLGPRQ